MNFPDDRKYTEHDEWVLVDGDVITVGLSDYAQDALGELVYIDLPQVGTRFEANAKVCEVESVKAVAEVYCPVDGEVIAVNEALSGSEGMANSDPYGEGWLYRLRVANPAQLESLMDAAAYQAKIAAH